MELHQYLTVRDRVLLRLLDEHQILWADQIERLLFANRRTCQLRLHKLRELGAVEPYRFAMPGRGGTQQNRWVLGLAGARFQAAATGRPLPSPRTHGAQQLRLSVNPALGHLLGINEFFTRLYEAARPGSDIVTTFGRRTIITPALVADAEHRDSLQTNFTRTSTDPAAGPGTTPETGSVGDSDRGPAEGGAELHGDRGQMRVCRWWSEQQTRARFPGITADGHGIWQAGGRKVGFFLEVDRGTETLQRLHGKLEAYQRLAQFGGPNYPVLFWLPNREREDNLQRYLRQHAVPPPRSFASAAGLMGVPVATATHGQDPAGQVWRSIDGWRTTHLHDLPANHGIDSVVNANWVRGQLDLSDQRDGAL